MPAVKKRNIRIEILIGFLWMSASMHAQQYAQHEFPSYFEISQNNQTLSSTSENLETHFYKKHFGFFCKIEEQVYRKNELPIRMRLGTTQYVDQKENKIPSYKLTSLKYSLIRQD